MASMSGRTATEADREAIIGDGFPRLLPAKWAEGSGKFILL
jgi:hypothetical protein